MEQSLSTSPPPCLKKQLTRRYYLTQRAKDANVFGILVSSLSQKHVISVVDTLRKRIQAADKASYSFAVGKINPAKLANFAEIDCFVLVACGEHSLLSNERDYHAPVITPLELDIALGNMEWGEQAYILDCHDIFDNNNNKDLFYVIAPILHQLPGKVDPRRRHYQQIVIMRPLE
jgi:diphthamide biosynthesis protein 2